MFAIIAGNVAEYVDWCNELGIAKNNKHIFYIRDRSDFYGWIIKATFYGWSIKATFHILLVGSYKERSDIKELMFFVRTHRMMEDTKCLTTSRTSY